jgi:hypothetical protein
MASGYYRTSNGDSPLAIAHLGQSQKRPFVSRIGNRFPGLGAESGHRLNPTSQIQSCLCLHVNEF